MAYIQKNNPFKKAKNPEPPEEDMTEKVHELPTAEVVEYSGTPSEIRKKRRKYEGLGANWELWKKRRQERLNKSKVDRSSELDFNPLS
jgi:hypothetical protein